jgi:hypothetical protein
MNTRKTTAAEPTPLFPGAPGQDQPVPNGAGATVTKAKPSVKLTAARLRMDPANETMGTARKLLTKLAVEPRPDPQWYVQTNPDSEFCLNSIGILEYRRDRRLYAVDPCLSEILRPYYRKHYIFTACTRTKSVFLWIIKMPGDDGGWNAWPSSMYGCALACAGQDWVQVLSGPGFYEARPADDYLPPPVWEELLYPCTTMDELIAIAFRQTYLDREDHPVVLDLLGRTQP